MKREIGKYVLERKMMRGLMKLKVIPLTNVLCKSEFMREREREEHALGCLPSQSATTSSTDPSFKFS